MYEHQTISNTANSQRVDIHRGLSQSEGEERLKSSGFNELQDDHIKSKWVMLLAQLNEPLIFVLFLAAAASMFLREFSDTVIILAVITLNAVVGVIQEGKAQKALEALKKLSSPRAVVLRDGKLMEIEAKSLVCGDVVSLSAGDQVPADLRLIQTGNLKIDEAALTGESVPAQKDALFLAEKELPPGDCKNMAFMSTSVAYGRGQGIVVATGMQTQIGKIAGLIHHTEQEATPLQKRLGDLGKVLSVVAVVLCAALFIIAVLQHRNIPEMLITAISLAVAAVPEGLPAVVTIVLALSVSRMVHVNTIIRRLPCVETLGAVNVVCSDKTGTLTQNKMTVMEGYADYKSMPIDKMPAAKYDLLYKGFALCNDASISKDQRLGDPTELALVDMADRQGLTKSVLDKANARVEELPFDSKRKMMTTVHRMDGKLMAFTKGSCDELLKRCSRILVHGNIQKLNVDDRLKILRALEEMSTRALRVLGVAFKEKVGTISEDDMIFLGMVGMMDPLRDEAKGAVEEFKKAGVRTVMITGDHKDTALAIARELGIAGKPEECMTGAQLDQMSDQQLSRDIDGVGVFARVSPEHKVRIVKLLKQNDNIIAMTGDGVNDAPALKAADIGIAMGKNGTDVARSASDMVLTDDNFATIEKAIAEGRGVYENIKKSVLFLLSSNFGEIITMFFAVLIGIASPLRASHILWINLITDSLPALALGVDQNDNKQLMQYPPRKAKESLFAHGGMFFTLFYGALISFISLAAFFTLPIEHLKMQSMPINLDGIKLMLSDPGILARAQTYAFTVLGLSQLFHAVGMRNIHTSFFKMKFFNNKLMLVAVAVGIALQMLVTEVPFLVEAFGTAQLQGYEWVRLIFLAALPMLAHELLLLRLPFLEGREKKVRETQEKAVEISSVR